MEQVDLHCGIVGLHRGIVNWQKGWKLDFKAVRRKMINKINKLKDFGIFRDFSWDGLEE